MNKEDISDLLSKVISDYKMRGVKILPPVTYEQEIEKHNEVIARSKIDTNNKVMGEISEAEAMDKFYSNGNTKD